MHYKFKTNPFFIIKGRNGTTLRCCNSDGSTPEILPEECLQIKVPDDEPDSNRRCLSVPRALDTSDKGCNIKPVRQVSDECTL